MSEFMPRMRVDERADRVRLHLDGFFSAEGPTLQDAADDLVWKLLVAAMGLRSGGIGAFTAVCRPDMRPLGFLWELAEIAAAGGDIRERVFGPNSLAA